MSVQYLIDFENVHETGLEGIRNLTSEDSVYILHTSGNDRILLSTLDNVSAWIRVIPVPPGRQSLDMHLVSFLGYLIGKEENPDTQYAVISNDTGYLGVAEFWNQACQNEDKVICAQAIWYALNRDESFSDLPDPAEITAAERGAISESIVRIFSKFAGIGLNNLPCMRVSELCGKLNGLDTYQKARIRLGKKPMQFLVEEFGDIVEIRKQLSQDWAYLVADRKTNPDEPLPEAPAEPDGGESMQTEEEEDIMEMELPSLDDFSMDPSAQDLPEPQNPVSSNFQSTAIELINSADNSENRDEMGRLRASVLRDRLMEDPEFRLALKNSGLKPIPFMQQLFEGRIEIFRDKGIYWACTAGDGDSEPAPEEDQTVDSGSESEIEIRKQRFYRQASDNIRTRLAAAGIDQAVAEEIADIFVHSNTAVEPRKVIHNLLRQRFGTKLGSKYYRETVKYI